MSGGPIGGPVAGPIALSGDLTLCWSQAVLDRITSATHAALTGAAG